MNKNTEFFSLSSDFIFLRILNFVVFKLKYIKIQEASVENHSSLLQVGKL